MAKTFLVFLITISSFLNIVAQNAQTNSDVEQAERLNKETGKLFALQRYDEAVRAAQQELVLREKIGNDLRTAGAHFNLATVYAESGKADEAARHFQAALPLYRKTLGETSDLVYSVYTSLARIAYAKNDKNAAAEFLKSALAVAEKVFGEQSEQFSKTSINLASVYAGLGRYEEAEKYYLQAISVNDKRIENAKVAFTERRDIYQYECFLYNSDPKNFEKRLNAFFENRRSPINAVNAQSGVVNSKAVRLVRPPFPPSARALHQTGTVAVRVVINEQGNVISAESYCGTGGNQQFLSAAVEAARKSRFSPTSIAGKPVKVSGVIIYNFTP